MRAVPAAEAGTVEIRQGDFLVYRAVTDGLAPHLGLRVPLRGSLAGACYREGVPLLVPDVLSDDRVEPELAERLHQRSCMLVPVRRGGVVVGVLKLQSSRPDAFAEEDLQVLGVLAGSVASGLAEAGERAANRAAALTEYRRRAVFDSAQDYAIILLDLDGRITDWNAGATRILGWRPEEMCGETADAFFTPEDRRDGIPAMEMQSALETGTGVDERWHLRRDGERFWANGEMMVLRDEAGAAIGFVKILRDRTEQKEAAARLQESQDRYQLAARATNDAIWDWNLATNHVLWNEALTEAYGHAPATVEPTGEWWIAQVHPEDRNRIDASIHAVIDGVGTTWTEEYRFRRADDSYAHVLDRGHVMRDADGRACRMIGAMLDLTARKRAEDALRTSERRLGLERGLLEAIFRQAPVGISIAGADDGRPSSLNAKAEEILGHGLGTQGDARYVSYGALHPDGRRYEPAEYPTLRALRKGETVRGEEMRYRNAETGELRLLEVSSGPVRDDEGAIQAAVTVLVDVGGQRRADAETRRLAALVEQSQDFIGLAAPDGSVDFVNEAGRRLVAYPTSRRPGPCPSWTTSCRRSARTSSTRYCQQSSGTGSGKASSTSGTWSRVLRSPSCTTSSPCATPAGASSATAPSRAISRNRSGRARPCKRARRRCAPCSTRYRSASCSRRRRPVASSPATGGWRRSSAIQYCRRPTLTATANGSPSTRTVAGSLRRSTRSAASSGKGSSTPRCAASTSAATVPGSGSRSPVLRCATAAAWSSARSSRSLTSTPAAGPRNGRICSTRNSRTG
ncbi:PAS domain S-box protein (plasmid) [Methylobacterium sp. NMS12]